MIHKAKKSLGQNFLKSQPALHAMCSASNITKSDVVLEIGPGKGALTEKLLECAGTVIAIEKDRDLITILEERFKDVISSGNLVLVHGDILNFNPEGYNLKAHSYKIAANIPYNITGAIIKKFLTETLQPSDMTLLVQKEVAERIVARDGKESILSLSVKAYGTPTYVMKVGKRFFSPEPKVDSAIIKISNISKGKMPEAEGVRPLLDPPLIKGRRNSDPESNFFRILHAGFAHKRKFAMRNLEGAGFQKEELRKIFQELNLSEKARAEDIPPPKWLLISRYTPGNVL
jgi:16S rRNA (adenine1518-N6/adenine1519-N6)-dimethyltransferase